MTSLVFFVANKGKKFKVLMKIVKIKEVKICIFWKNITYMILKVTKKQSFSHSSDIICFEMYSLI